MLAEARKIKPSQDHGDKAKPPAPCMQRKRTPQSTSMCFTAILFFDHDHMNAQLPTCPLAMAMAQRRYPNETVHYHPRLALRDVHVGSKPEVLFQIFRSKPKVVFLIFRSETIVLFLIFRSKTMVVFLIFRSKTEVVFLIFQSKTEVFFF